MPDHDPGKKPAGNENHGNIMTARKPRVLFICTHNSVRSQIAEGYLRARHSDLFEVFSAGSEVRGVHPLAVAVMYEIGIDISGQRSKLVDEFFHAGIDIIVKVCDCAHEGCPFFPGVRQTIHAAFPDPSSCTGPPRERIARFREVRDRIVAWIDHSFVLKYGQSPFTP
jgi:arsenate reductase (thioredoxin)